MLDTQSGVPFYKQIISLIENQIAEGTLVPGDKLPTVRSYAIELKVNANTVAKAYTELEKNNIVVTQVGSGTFIKEAADRLVVEKMNSEGDISKLLSGNNPFSLFKFELAKNHRDKLIKFLAIDTINKAKLLGFTKEEIAEYIKNMES